MYHKVSNFHFRGVTFNWSQMLKLWLDYKMTYTRQELRYVAQQNEQVYHIARKFRFVDC